MKARFQTFVAARYLMARPVHLSIVALIVTGIAVVTGAVLLAVAHWLVKAPVAQPGEMIDPTHGYIVIAGAIGFAVAGVTLYVFTVRLFFTFYTTVSVVGVSVGVAALVTVLSVMNGFEGHLRHKILGSNAHIQVGKEEGEFTEWEEISARVAKIKGVVASTPFASSEVVIAANNNYANVAPTGLTRWPTANCPP